MLLLYLFLLICILAINRMFKKQNDINSILFTKVLQSGILYIILFFSINALHSILTYSSILKFLLKLIKYIFTRVSFDALLVKKEVAAQVLTTFEIGILLSALLFNAILIFLFLIKNLKESFAERDIRVSSVVIANNIFYIISGLVIFYYGILSDLIFRPLWMFMCFLLLTCMITLDSRNMKKKRIYFSKNNSSIRFLLYVSMSLFIMGNLIYSRYHLLTSSVYTHESSTIKILSSLKY